MVDTPPIEDILLIADDVTVGQWDGEERLQVLSNCSLINRRFCDVFQGIIFRKIDLKSTSYTPNRNLEQPLGVLSQKPRVALPSRI